MPIAYYSNDLSLASVSQMQAIMETATQNIPSSQLQLAASANDIFTICPQSIRGVSVCYGAIQWNEIDPESGIYNYTIRSSAGRTSINVLDKSTSIDKYILPLQLAIDNAIANTTTTANSIPFTSITNEENSRKRDQNYLNLVRNWVSPFMYIGLIGVVYQLAGFVAEERELGLTDLLDSMGSSSFSRITAYVFSYSAVYLASWIGNGILMYFLFFKHSNAAIPIVSAILNGAASVSWAILLGTLFKRAQMAGIISACASFVLALLTAVQTQAGDGPNSPAALYVLSFLFNPMSYSFMVQLMAINEGQYLPLNLFQHGYNNTTYPFVVFIAPIFQFFFYIALALIFDRFLYGKIRASKTLSNSENAIEISNLTKVYTSTNFQLKKSNFTAVDNLSLSIASNQIYSLLGANGSGKTTTLEMIAGIQKSTSGSIAFKPGTRLGICPQKNVLWENLTVAEHIRIWSEIKGVPVRHLPRITDLFIEKCGLVGKESTFSQNLSGGQQRKLQLAVMFTGGTNVCCIDEVSSGVDPHSRRLIWDILMMFKRTHTIILTTHFLDEADILSDHIAVLSKGVLQAQGSPMQLKESFGEGYRVFIDRAGTGQEESYSFPNAQAVIPYISELEQNNISYRVAGPELEDAFLKLARKDHDGISLEEIETKLVKQDSPSGSSVVQSKQIGFFVQLQAMILKRLIILMRSPFADIAYLLLPIIVGAACHSFLQHNEPTLVCNALSRYSDQTYTHPQNIDFNMPITSGLSTSDLKSFLTAQSSFQNITSNITNGIHYVNSFDNFYNYIKSNFSSVKPGGLSLDNGYTLAYQADSSDTSHSVFYASFMMNMLSNVLNNRTQTIVTSYSPFQNSWVVSTSKDLQFSIFFSLGMGIGPAFASLYPTFERLSKVRAMQYSNGLRVLPLWTAYILYYLVIMLILCDICLGIMASGLNTIYAAGHMYLCFLLFLISATLTSFIISLFVKSQLAAFATAAAYQAVGVLLYLMAFLSLQAFGDPTTLNSTLRVVYFAIASVSPIQSLLRSIFLSMNLFSVFCDDDNNIYPPAHLFAYGGPIMMLFLQCIVLFGILIWWESGSPLRDTWRRLKAFVSWRKNWMQFEDQEMGEFQAIPEEVLQEKNEIETNLERYADGLALKNVRREYSGKFVVDGVSFGVQRGECFALLGPNGAGKTTTFNMIRGEVTPTDGDIFVNGIPVVRNRALARTKLGVCPQFDAMDKMTVVEVLRFYARLRGIQGSKITIHRHIEELIVAVDLVRFRTRIAHKLSGGNKRKLSLAVALIGNPDVLLLDEPSTGMDAFAKRIMWRTLSKAAPGRSIVLTTHSMEEADALANRAGILARKMLAIGSVETLRAKYGNVIHVHLVCNNAPATSEAEMDVVVNVVLHMFPGATVEDRMYQGQIKLAIPTRRSADDAVSSNIYSQESMIGTSSAAANEVNQTHNSVADVFKVFENNKQLLGIQSYSVYPTRLEEVFLKLVGDYVDHNE